MKTVRIRNTAVATDINVCEIYHTNNPAGAGPHYKMSSSVSQSGQYTGDDLASGLEFQVDDNVTQFYVKNISRCVNIGSGSLSEDTTAIEYHSIFPGDYGSVSVVGTETKTFSTNTTVRQNFNTHPSLTVTATGNYPYEFGGWWTSDEYIGSPQSLANPLAIYSGSRHAYVTGSSQVNITNETKQWHVRWKIGSSYY